MRSIPASILLSLVLGLGLVACGDDGGGSSGSGSDDGDGDGDGDGSGDGSGDGDGDGSGDGTGTAGGVTTCAALCDQAPVATPQEGTCVYEFMFNAGYPIAGADDCQGVVDTADCNACYAAIEPTDADCAAAYDACF